MTANHVLHPQCYEERLHLPRNEGRREIWQIRQILEEEKRGLNDYEDNRSESTLKDVTKEQLLRIGGTKNDHRRDELMKGRVKWENKVVHGQYHRDMNVKSMIKILGTRQKTNNYPKETENLKLAA